MSMSIVQNKTQPASRLSATDAFFVAYQQHSGILMQLGGEIELEGELRREDLEQMISYVVARWPRLGQALQKSLLGLKWKGNCLTGNMLRIGKGSDALSEWRNEPIDPFHEPPFQVLWIPPPHVGCPRGDPLPNGGSSTVAFRAHHAVMDGESFVAVTTHAAHFLTQARIGKQAAPPEPAQASTLNDLISPGQLIRRGRLGRMWRYTRWLAAEARGGRSARLAIDTCTTGDTHTCERRLDADAFARLKQRAAALRVAPTWLCAAAWMRAIHRWNVSRGWTANTQVSLEFPVSLRRGRHNDRKNGYDLLGNFISPLVLFGDATQPLDQLARELRKQLTGGIRSQSHLGTPLLTAPGKFLPWALFRRVAVNPRTTGFATSHFTWFEQSDIHADIARLSEGALRLTGQRIYTPVCLHMGAAAAVLASPEYAQIFLTYRATALSNEAAGSLLDLMVAELEGNSEPQAGVPARAARVGW
jgi:hypothetical protein